LRAKAAADTQPANLHSGSCNGGETIRDVLSNVRGGRSTTLPDVAVAKTIAVNYCRARQYVYILPNPTILVAASSALAAAEPERRAALS
jgi:hypothetical protein